jgi:hypothetical protein
MKPGVILFALCWLVIASPVRGIAQTGAEREYELKAAVLYHIIEYVEWPKDSVAEAGAVRIGLLGNIPYAEAMQVLNGKTLQGRKLVIKRIEKPEDAGDCQVVFISSSEKPRIAQIISEFKSRPILTVSEVEGFAERGGIVNLIAGQNRINMEINREVAKESRLSISSQLLKLAKIYPR